MGCSDTAGCILNGQSHGYPWIVGYHWFEWVDQPPEGRFDGEDNNWGVVSEADEVYEIVTARMTEVNPEVWARLRVPD